MARIAADEDRMLSTGRTPVDLKFEIEAIRTSGYAQDRDEHTSEISVAGIAFSVRGAVYAISIPALSLRFRKEREALVKKLLAVREEVARILPDAEIRRG